MIKCILLFSFAVFLAIAIPPPKIFPHWLLLNESFMLEYENRTYFIGIEKKNFFSSLIFCKSKDMDLVSINNEAENDKLGKFINKIGLENTPLWTSGTSLPDGYWFYWLSTAQSIDVRDFNNWFTPKQLWQEVQEDESKINRTCIEVTYKDGRNGTKLYWTDEDCLSKFGFICERPGSKESLIKNLYQIIRWY